MLAPLAQGCAAHRRHCLGDGIRAAVRADTQGWSESPLTSAPRPPRTTSSAPRIAANGPPGERGRLGRIPASVPRSGRDGHAPCSRPAHAVNRPPLQLAPICCSVACHTAQRRKKPFRHPARILTETWVIWMSEKSYTKKMAEGVGAAGPRGTMGPRFACIGRSDDCQARREGRGGRSSGLGGHVAGRV